MASPSATLTAIGADMPATSLDEVLAAAELTTRVDRKYIVPHAMIHEVVACVTGAASSDLHVLEIDGRRSSLYETVYFDTPNRQSYLGAAYGRRRRFKVRTRTYLDSDRCQLEVKLNGGRGESAKVALAMPSRDRGRITAEGYAFISEHLPVTLDGPLHPAVTTRYRRMTVVDYAGTARITCDTDLSMEAPDGRVACLDAAVVVETKSSGPPTMFDRVLWRHGCRPAPISKFAVGMALLVPGLPANKWHRTLNRPS
ncbi:MAG TPA: polyphosphate polymerase domain-containing protein [Ilumatobacteraceae bacterium]|nr:polyphosphate polymerase domain-containing protein [Ilumatobacteraceae bacterium]